MRRIRAESNPTPTLGTQAPRMRSAPISRPGREKTPETHFAAIVNANQQHSPPPRPTSPGKIKKNNKNKQPPPCNDEKEITKGRSRNHLIFLSPVLPISFYFSPYARAGLLKMLCAAVAVAVGPNGVEEQWIIE